MERFYGFDLGDAESAVSRLDKNDKTMPEVLALAGTKSLVTAYAVTNNGELKIGENACYASGVSRRKIRFKSHFLTDSSSAADIKSFASGVLGELYADGQLIRGEDCCFYVGCPAGWNRNARERYREIFENIGYPPAKIVSESRAALVSACQSRHLQVGYDILSKPVLVVDIGSSTTDFAYVCGGKEVDIQTAGEVTLGGGIMDEILLEESLEASPNGTELRKLFASSEPWKNYCEFTARRLKEKYFSDEAYWQENRCTESVVIPAEKPIRLVLTMNQTIADHLLNRPVERLGNRSFREVFEASLKDVQNHISGASPDLVFLTGGVSKLPEIRTICENGFPDAVIVGGAEPEFSVSRGLAWCGRIDDELRDFRLDLENLRQSTVVEDIVRENIPNLYRAIVEALTEPMIRNAALPVFERYRNGEIRRLSDTDSEMQTSLEAYLRSDQAKALLKKPITDWLRPISDRLEMYTVPICIKHNVPYSAMSLKSYLSDTDIDIHIEARQMFGVEELTWLIDSIVSVIIGLFCGGSGIALITSGLPGIVIGFAASFMVLALGKSQMEKALLKADLPKPMRKLIPRNLFEARMDNVTDKVKASLLESLENEKNEEIASRMVEDISGQIETCLIRMAEIVEIPLGY